MRQSAVLLVLLIAALTVPIATAFVGDVSVSPAVLWQGSDNPAIEHILWNLRIPRIAAAFLAGAALALGGVAFQALFRNSLATPFTLGISSGASLGMVLAIYGNWKLSLAAGLGLSTRSWCAFLGAMGATGLVYGLSRFKRGFSTASMLLAGVAVSFFFSALILLMQYASDASRTFRMLRAVMGGFADVRWNEVLAMLPLVAAGVALLAMLVRELNLLATGEELAVSRGMDVVRCKKVIFVAVSLMAGGIVAVCGPIGFVGLIAPHICRLLVGSDHRVLMPASALFGGTFLVLCDAAARTVLAPAELPVGIITALLGGPFFLGLLLFRENNV